MELNNGAGVRRKILGMLVMFSDLSGVYMCIHLMKIY